MVFSFLGECGFDSGLILEDTSGTEMVTEEVRSRHCPGEGR